jgi:hypothetical protein
MLEMALIFGMFITKSHNDVNLTLKMNILLDMFFWSNIEIKSFWSNVV